MGGTKNPAYRPATEKALVTGLFLWTRFAGDSSGSPRGGLTAVSKIGRTATAGSLKTHHAAEQRAALSASQTSRS